MGDQVGVYYFSNIVYNFLRQRPQQLFDAWTKSETGRFAFFFVEPPATKLKVIARDAEVHVAFPWDDQRLKRFAGGIDAWVGGRKEVKIAIVSSWVWEPYIAKRAFDLICYDYADQIAVAAELQPTALARHKAVVKKSGLVFAAADQLREDVLALEPRKEVVLVTSGVDPSYFADHKDRHTLTGFVKTRPIIGFVGAIYDWIDLEFLLAVATKMPEADFVLVGPLNDTHRRLAETKPANVHFPGVKTYEAIPPCIDLFDVALIPFKISNISDATDPIKLYEYFALGKPVVASRMRQLARFDDGKLLQTAHTIDEWIAAIGFFLGNDRDEWIAARKKIAEDNAWAGKAQLILAQIEKRLERIAATRGRKTGGTASTEAKT